MTESIQAARERLYKYISAGRRGVGERRYKSNTRIQRNGDTVRVILYETPVLAFESDNSVILNSGGWRTPTTKSRMNEFLPSGACVYQSDSEWYLTVLGQHYPFAEGMRILPSGQVEGCATATDLKARKKLRRRILTYCRKAHAALKAGEVADPGPGDCFYCLMRETKTGKPLGECTGDTSHLELHLEESYIVPSLLWRAVETGGRGNPPTVWAMRQNLADLVAIDVRYYLYEQFGLQRRTGGLRFTY